VKHGSFSLSAGSAGRTYDTLLKTGAAADVARRIMARDASVYSTEKKLKALIANRLGWVDVASTMRKQIPLIEKFGNKALADGIKHVVLIGMGGSSLCPELFGLVFGKHPKLKSYHVLDSTDPIAVAAVDKQIDLKKALFIVASKSGGTVETRSHEAYFLARLKQEQIKNPGKHFAAITDKGSDLGTFAKKNKYRQIFVNPSDIGGRYSALSFFGLVPAFFAGANLRTLLDSACMWEGLLRDRTGESNPGLALGTLLAAAWKGKRDKLTIVASKRTSPLVPWIEQLVAESTGKQKRGIVPIENEPALAPDKYGKDRMFVFLRMHGESDRNRALLVAMLKRKAPVIEIVLESPYDLGGQFLVWESATAVAGWYLKINPFDEPNVTESKENTKAILAAFGRIGSMPIPEAHAVQGHLSLLLDDKSKRYTAKKNGSLKILVGKFLKHAKPPQYVAILNYYPSDDQTEKGLLEIRRSIGTKYGVATLRGYGPRFLHSIGQLYKGGPQTGMFIVLVRNQYATLPIPGQPFDFGQLITAQAIGDTQALVKRKLPVLLIGVDGLPGRALRELQTIIRSQK
jgi:glucose-6-phosphate isomerase